MRRPEYLFGRATEAACVDPHNPYILAQQLACAAYELPVGDDDEAAFGEQMRDVLAALDEAGETRVIDGRAYWSRSDFPGARVSLRSMTQQKITAREKCFQLDSCTNCHLSDKVASHYLTVFLSEACLIIHIKTIKRQYIVGIIILVQCCSTISYIVSR